MDIPIDAEVVCIDGTCGHSTHVILDPRTQKITHVVVRNGHGTQAEHLVTHLVMREGHLWGKKDVTIPVSHIERYQEKIVYLDLAKKEVEALPTIPIRRG